MKGFYVYFLYNLDKTLLYIGKTTRLRTRLGWHFYTDDVSEWKNTVDKENVAVYQCRNACDLDVYETYFINKYRPLYNKDKVFNATLSFEFPYLPVTIYNFKEKAIEKNILLKEISRYLYLKTVENLTSFEKQEVERFVNSYKRLAVCAEKLTIEKISNIGLTLQDYVEFLKDSYDSLSLEDVLAVEFIFEMYPWVKVLINNLGLDETVVLIEKEKFNTTNLTRKSQRYIAIFTQEKIDIQLSSYFEVKIDGFISSKRLKEIFKEVYDCLKITRVPKSTDIKEYYSIETTCKYIKGETVRGLILKEKLFHLPLT